MVSSTAPEEAASTGITGPSVHRSLSALVLLTAFQTPPPTSGNITTIVLGVAAFSVIAILVAVPAIRGVHSVVRRVTVARRLQRGLQLDGGSDPDGAQHTTATACPDCEETHAHRTKLGVSLGSRPEEDS